MRAVQVREFGAPEVWRAAEVEDPIPEVVAVEGAGVIFGDTLVRSGSRPRPLPYMPGMEVGGQGVVGAFGVVWVNPEAGRGADVEVALKPASSGELTPRIHRGHPPERSDDAHADLEARRTIGAVLLHP